MESSRLLPRYLYYGDGCYYDNDGYCNSAWDRWGRWVLLAVIIVAAFLIFFLFSCISARRRRRLGYAPYRGTGWSLGRTPPGHAPAQYTQQPPQENYSAQPYYGNNNSNNAYQAPPPAYGAAQDYYGASNNVELQQPQNTYKPPQGPPPSHNAYA